MDRDFGLWYCYRRRIKSSKERYYKIKVGLTSRTRTTAYRAIVKKSLRFDFISQSSQYSLNRLPADGCLQTFGNNTHMNFIRYSLFGAAAFLCAASSSYSSEISDLAKAADHLYFYDSKYWKPTELEPADWELIHQKEKYLLEHQAVLMKAVKNRQDGWNSCAYGLARSKDPKVTTLFIQLLRQNFYLKEVDGSRKEFGFGSKNGCEVETNHYGSVFASLLGIVGDDRAIPVLKEAVSQGDQSVQASAYYALCKLEEISIEELIKIVKNTDHPSNGILTVPLLIISDVKSRDPASAIKLYDRVIAELPVESFQVATAQYNKIECYQDLKEYDHALEQCDVVSKMLKFENYTQQMPRLRERIKKQAEQDTALKNQIEQIKD